MQTNTQLFGLVFQVFNFKNKSSYIKNVQQLLKQLLNDKL